MPKLQLLLAIVICLSCLPQVPLLGAEPGSRLFLRDRCVSSAPASEARIFPAILGMIASFAIDKIVDSTASRLKDAAQPKLTTVSAERGIFLYRSTPAGIERSPAFGCLIFLVGDFSPNDASAEAYQPNSLLQDTFSLPVTSNISGKLSDIKEFEAFKVDGIVVKDPLLLYEVAVRQSEDPRYFQLENVRLWVQPGKLLKGPKSGQDKNKGYASTVTLTSGGQPIAVFTSQLAAVQGVDNEVDLKWTTTDGGRSSLIPYGSALGEAKLMLDTEQERMRRALALQELGQQAASESGESREHTLLAIQALSLPLPTAFVPLQVRIEVAETVEKNNAAVLKALSSFLTANKKEITASIKESLPLPQTAEERKKAAENAEKAKAGAIANYRSACLAYLRSPDDATTKSFEEMILRKALEAARKLNLSDTDLGGDDECKQPPREN